MKLYISSVLLCLGFIAYSIGQETTAVVVTYDNLGGDAQRLNRDEDIRLLCDITTSGSIGKVYYMKWFKQQSTADPVVVGQDENLLNDPFKGQPDKYSVGFNIVSSTETRFYLDVKGLTEEDAGKYFCDAGETGKTLRSGPASLIVNPVKAEVSEPVLSSKAPEDAEGVKKFENGHYEVKCSTSVKSNSDTLKLVIMLGEDDITQDFQHTTGLEWGGVNGLETPSKNLEARREHWAPRGYGPNTLKCIVKDGDVELSEATMKVAKDEPPVTASLNCTSDYKGLLKEGVLDYSFVCRLYDLDEQSEKRVTYEFEYEGKMVTMNTGDNEYKRKASKFGEDTFILEIPRITLGMTKNGGVKYNITLSTLQDDTWEPVPEASTIFTAEAIETGPLGSSANTYTLGNTLLIASLLISFVKCFY